jgi:hypothetical protein
MKFAEITSLNLVAASQGVRCQMIFLGMGSLACGEEF